MKRTCVAALAALALACGGESKAPEPAAAPTPATAPAAPAAPSAPTPAPAPAAAAPTGSLRGDAAAGAQLYATYCASCHGPEGKGDGPVAATLNPRPANHTDHVYMGSLSDEHLYQVISKGGASVGKSPLMAPWGGVVNDQGIRDLIAHIRKLSGT
jgi:mono/diheme cytochrome c family protein